MVVSRTTGSLSGRYREKGAVGSCCGTQELAGLDMQCLLPTGEKSNDQLSPDYVPSIPLHLEPFEERASEGYGKVKVHQKGQLLVIITSVYSW